MWFVWVNAPDGATGHYPDFTGVETFIAEHGKDLTYSITFKA